MANASIVLEKRYIIERLDAWWRLWHMEDRRKILVGAFPTKQAATVMLTLIDEAEAETGPITWKSQDEEATETL